MRKTKFRFSSPTVLRGDAPFLGATVQEWDDAITGNMEKSLAAVKKLADLNRPPVRFVDDQGTTALPRFVTRTSLNALLADDQDADPSPASEYSADSAR